MLLLLEDDAERTVRFRASAARLGIELRVWRSAFEMLNELPAHFPHATLIGLDHDLISDDLSHQQRPSRRFDGR